MKLSLVMATVRRTEEIRRLVRSLAEQTDRNLEVILVDQNPDDRLAALVGEASALGLQVIQLRLSPPSLTRARNLGIAHASGDIIGFPDDDCWYEPEVVASVRAEFLKDLSLEGTIACWVEQSNARKRRPLSGTLSLQAWRRFRDGDASSITLFFKRSLIARLDGFDERFGVGCWFGAAEETDFVLRALVAGARLNHCCEARVHHHFVAEPKGAWPVILREARKRARGTGAIYAKHRMDAWIVMRGLIAPIVVPLFRGRLRLAIKGAFVSLGRIEGLVRWRLKESK